MSPSGSVNRGESGAGDLQPPTHVGDAAPFLGSGVSGNAGAVGEAPAPDAPDATTGEETAGCSVLPWHAAAVDARATSAMIRVVNLRTCSSERLEKDRKDTDPIPAW
jgi:hypothetical protein